ncbi:protein disulfide isomerase-like 5-2 [Iris pallida]|uniref:Protein disulfide isomerase-like 5-2 n=1 Tax=Iris pallida TaxID=29817 RepID=A0AAX6FU85_IRIPA|nr:protein disulfide isomerase-like 5-2 [Iris pallida]
MKTSRGQSNPLVVGLLPWLLVFATASSSSSKFARVSSAESDAPRFSSDGRVLELVESDFESAISSFDFVLVDFYAPWCGHCKKLSPELDVAAPILAGLNEPIVIAKINADKYRKLGDKYDIDGFPTLKLFMHGVPIDYNGPRKADLLVRYLRKFVAPDVSILESDSAIHKFIETAGKQFPIFIGFGLNESMVVDFARKYKKKAWFSAAQDFSEEVMITYDFDKVPALVALHPKYDERSVFYGPFDGEFLEDFIKQNQLPLVVPINFETLKQLSDDKRKIVLTILEDEMDQKSLALAKTLRAAANANRDLVFGYVGVKQWGEFVETFNVNKGSELPKIIVWDGTEEYQIVEGSESLNDDDNKGSQISRFLEGYREGRTVTKRVNGPSFRGFINSLIGIGTVYIIVFVVVVVMLIQSFAKQGEEGSQPVPTVTGVEDAGGSVSESESSKKYQPGDKED